MKVSYRELFKISPSLRSGRTSFKLLQTVLRNVWFEIKTAPYGVREIELGRSDAAFLEFSKDANERTLLDPARLFLLWQVATHATSLPGDVAEFGVYRGGSAKLIGQIFQGRAPDRKVHLFDTFAGMPAIAEEQDIFAEGDLQGSGFEDVTEYLSGLENLVFYEGLFRDTVGNCQVEQFSFIHIDCDIYQSVIEACNFFYPRMTSGGMILFDDYGFVSCAGAKNAVDEFFSDKPECPLYPATGQCLVVRR